jgi:hypothetical protein
MERQRGKVQKTMYLLCLSDRLLDAGACEILLAYGGTFREHSGAGASTVLLSVCSAHVESANRDAVTCHTLDLYFLVYHDGVRNMMISNLLESSDVLRLRVA